MIKPFWANRDPCNDGLIIIIPIKLGSISSKNNQAYNQGG